MNQIAILSHDLNSAWGVIGWVAGILDEQAVSAADYRMYEAMISRARASMLSVFLTLVSLRLIQPSRLDALTELVEQLDAPNAPFVAAALKPLVTELQQILQAGSPSYFI